MPGGLANLSRSSRSQRGLFALSAPLGSIAWPKRPNDRSSHTLGGPSQKADLGFGSGSARFSSAPRDIGSRSKGEPFYVPNRASLIGFLGKDAEVRTTNSKTPFTVLSLATKRSWKDRESGEYQSQTTWHRCLVWGKLGEFAATLTKGAHVQIEGELRTREYTQKGPGKKAVEVTKSITEVHAVSIVKLDRSGKPESTVDPEAAA